MFKKFVLKIFIHHFIQSFQLNQPADFPESWMPGTGHILILWCVIDCFHRARFVRYQWNPSSHQLAVAPEFSPPPHVLHLLPPEILWKTDPNL